MFNSKGQSLIELIIVITVGLIIIGALVFATISSLRNAQFASDQIQATKLAQEGLEKIRTLRDRNIASFNDLWAVPLSCPTNCYFYFNSSQMLLGGTSVNLETIPPGNFQRQFLIEDYVDGTKQKQVTAIVKWSDFAGPHESRLTTILRNINI